jgi:hypothetical protein
VDLSPSEHYRVAPAQPGFWSQHAHLDRETGEVVRTVLPVVAWAVWVWDDRAESVGGEAVVCDEEGQLCDASRWGWSAGIVFERVFYEVGPEPAPRVGDELTEGTEATLRRVAQEPPRTK